MRIHLLVTVGLALALVLLVSAFGPGDGAAAAAPCDRWVLADGANSSDCRDQTNPCKTVQYAINQAADGDRICVADRSGVAGPTTYHESLTINRTLSLDGKWEASCRLPPSGCTFSPVACDATKVVLNAKGLGRVITIDGRYSPTIDCFTISGGDAAGLGGDPGGRVDNDAGGGIYGREAAPIIINNIITGNLGCETCPASYGRGGGIYLLNAPSSASISGNLITHNVADNSTWGMGGGIMLRDSDAQVRNNTISENRAGLSAGDGGGITVRGGMPTIANNKIALNKAGQAVMGQGGGIFVWSSETATIEHNLIDSNLAISGEGDLTSRGGGIACVGDPTMVAVIHGNTIRNNTAAPLPPFAQGGGIYVSGLVAPSEVSDNTLDWNIAGFNAEGQGGGVYVYDSEVTIRGNDLTNNSATWTGEAGAGGIQGTGGGLYISGGSVVVQDNEIAGNYGAGFPGAPSIAQGYGGGMAISGSLTIVQSNLIANNSATRAEAAGVGGGIYGLGGTTRMVRNRIAGNQGTPVSIGYGGGMYLQSMNVWLDANTIVDNVAAGGSTGRGGGVRITVCAPFTLTNNIIAGNQASQYGSGVAVGAGSSGTLAHNTIADNALGDGIGVHVNSTGDVALVSNIVAGHTTGIANGGTGSVTADYTLFEANTTNYGAGVVSSNEVAGPAALLADYHIGSGSGAIDHAPVLSWVTWDIDGDPRPLGPLADVGADEYGSRIYLPVVMRNAHLRGVGEPR